MVFSLYTCIVLHLILGAAPTIGTSLVLIFLRAAAE